MVSAVLSLASGLSRGEVQIGEAQPPIPTFASGYDLTVGVARRPGKIRAAVSTKLDFSVEKIEKMIGWKAQISFEEGIRRLINWREKEQSKAA